MIVFLKSHPVTQAMSGAAKPADLMEPGLRRNPGEPDAAQAEANSYSKPTVKWQGLTIAIENPAGSVRRGRNRHGVTWEVRMRFDYGEIVGTLGVDGDPVDVIMGPDLEAPMVYVVHQRRVNDWDNYDEDKCCVGFSSQSDAEQAFLSNYNDPRFLGPVTAMPVAEFVAKVRATRTAPAMIKAALPVVLFFKAHVGAYLRGGRMVSGYQGRDAKPAAGQMSLFGGPMSGKPLPPSPLQGKDAVQHTPDMFDDVTPTSADNRIGPNPGLYDGTTIRDSKGQQYRVHYNRNSLVIAHPIVDGRAQVSADTSVRFWVNPDQTPSGDSDRTDPIYIVGGR